MMPVKSIFFLFVIVVCLIILVSYGITGNVKFWETLGLKAGSLQLGGAYPQVLNIYMQNFLCPAAPSGTPAMTMTEDGTTNGIRINATVYEINGDCSSVNFIVNATLCDSLKATCNWAQSGLGVIKVPLSFIAGQQWGTGGVFCNFSGTYGLDYYQRWGDWKINVTATDPTFYTNNTQRYWYYTESTGFGYPYPSGNLLDFGSLIMNQWNNNTAGYTLKDTGNIRINLTWNATDFTCWTSGTCGSDTIAITGTNLCTDNNNVPTDGCGYIPTPSSNTVWWQPAGGVRRCSNLACTGDEDGGSQDASYTEYWDIYISTGLLSGTYNNSIWTTAYPYKGAG